MTHQQPIPQAAQSPYPLHPAPHNASLDAFRAPVKPAEAAPENSPFTTQLIAVGAAFLGSAALAAWYYRRSRSAPARAASKSSDRKLLAGKQLYEVSYFARKHRLTASQAREIIAEAGSSRATANRLASERRG